MSRRDPRRREGDEIDGALAVVEPTQLIEVGVAVGQPNELRGALIDDRQELVLPARLGPPMPIIFAIDVKMLINLTKKEL